MTHPTARRACVCLIALVALAPLACRSATVFGKDPDRPRPPAGAVVAEHPLAVAAGIDVLEEGGNAADAAVATALVLAVVYPQAGNLGGGGFALWVPHVGAAHALDFRETAPSAVSTEAYVDAAGQRIAARSLRGPLAVAVPGSPAGLWRLWNEHGSGRFEFARVCARAIELARDGFEVDAWLARDLARANPAEFNAAARAVFFPEGRALREGDRLLQPALARTLTRYARQGVEGFYTGETARALVDELARTALPDGAKREGAWITLDDLRAYQAKDREPLIGWFRGQQIVTMPPPSSGGVALLQILGILEGLPLDAERIRDENEQRVVRAGSERAGSDVAGLSERMLHWWIEASRAAFADRAEHLGDPDFVDVPVERLLSSSWISARRVAIGESAAPDVEAFDAAREGGETTHLSVLDARGNAVSLTTTLNTTFGSGVLVEGGGFLLNNEMDDFALAPGSPNTFELVGGAANAPAPGKRPLSSMTPTVLRDGGHANVFVLGSPGGPRIISAVAQVLLRTLVLEQSLADAVAAPRVHQQWRPLETFVEPGFDEELLGALENRRGHVLRRLQERFASVQAIRLERAGAPPQVASDARRGGSGALTGGEPTVPAKPPAK